jgi:hypothetical protein
MSMLTTPRARRQQPQPPPGRLRLVHAETGEVLWYGPPRRAAWSPDEATVEVDGRRYRVAPGGRTTGLALGAPRSDGRSLERTATFRVTPT